MPCLRYIVFYIFPEFVDFAGFGVFRRGFINSAGVLCMLGERRSTGGEGFYSTVSASVDGSRSEGAAAPLTHSESTSSKL